MSVREASALEKAESTNEDLMQELSVPSAGLGDIVSDYVGAAGEKSIDLLSTTAVAAELTDYNEYYDSNGGILGKLIVCNVDTAVPVYDRIPGNERVERGDTQMAQIVGRMEKGDIATLIGESGFWYQIVADSFHGYVNADLFATGKDAEALNDATWMRIAVVNDEELMLNVEPDYNSELLGLLSDGLWFEVVEEGDEFSLIRVPDVGEGWVENAYVVFQTVRRVGISNEDSAYRAQKIAECVSAAEDFLEEQEEAAYWEEIQQKFAHIDPSIPDSDDVAALREAVANYAQQFVGWLPYVYGGNSLESGADCCGFTQAIYREFGYDIPRTTDGQMYGGMAVSLDDIRPGDIIYYGGHVALYIGGDTVVHEPVPGDVCSYQSMYMMPIYGVVRYIN
ncbi:MAG: C40 family peptidase [Lachnospiraceae bacterium]|nr:C40 family peptidase [Lachnospiraceae bacterium]